MIQNFEDFCRELNTCGFSMGGGNAKGIFALIDYDWLNQDMLVVYLDFVRICYF